MYYSEDELKKILDGYSALLERGEKNLYRKYTIKKKGGGGRVICAPCDELKELQYKLLALIKRIPIGGSATAYENKCSIKKNAQLHIGARHLLHADIKDFFPSVSRNMFEDIFCKGISSKLADQFWRAVSYNKGIPIGAPTSPFIGNRVMREIDSKLEKIGFFIKYTRYADDMVFSSRWRMNKNLIKKVEKIIGDAGFNINYKKTYFMSYRKEVTGIIINDKKLSTGTNFKKRLKSDIYDYLAKGEGYPDIIRGKFSHLKHIEPAYAKKIITKYRKIDKNNYLKTI